METFPMLLALYAGNCDVTMMNIVLYQNIFDITDGETNDDRWIPLTKGQ